ncbi:uncharacterized protein LOC132201282 isoform X1 [Neocloeon triangulifer]|uniref:uncharacterized protein LOC132201282 isoform X1 n=1 Tax=Neocloeon triangulifer TaxID=2078957 RepID=UPI00286F61F7|nr:uncharacterized protein LOC132201282 isoform X1 [Neocloeon triangulifer]
MADSNKRNIPIKLGDFSVIDSEFSNIRERFDAEMRKMEDEMTRFRSELMNRESNFFKTTTSHQSHSSESIKNWSGPGKFVPHQKQDEHSSTSSTFHSSSSSTTASSDGRTGGGEVRTWLDGLDSPLIQPDGADNKMLKLRFDVSQYAPEEIVVKTVDNKLMVHAKHEEKSDSKSVYREYNREFLLPKGTNPEDIKSSLSKDGVLTVEAPLPALGPGEARIPITQN